MPDNNKNKEEEDPLIGINDVDNKIEAPSPDQS